jgi:NADH:ubiquinone oxidoreductase subunit D
MFGFPFYPFREREKLFDLFEAVAGQRMMFNYIRIGGVVRNPPFGWFDQLKYFLDEFNQRIDEYEAIVTENPIFLKRTQGVGYLSKEVAMNFGMSGPCVRASGIPLDLRKTKPYSIYPEINFKVPVRQEGDTWARYMCRIAEMREELRKGLGTTGPEKDDSKDLAPEMMLMAKKQNAGLRVKAGEGFSAVESPRGTIGCYVVSNGSDKAYRFRWRNPSFCNLSAVSHMLVGSPIADVMAIFGSIDVILPDVDR